MVASVHSTVAGQIAEGVVVGVVYLAIGLPHPILFDRNNSVYEETWACVILEGDPGMRSDAGRCEYGRL